MNINVFIDTMNARDEAMAAIGRRGSWEKNGRGPQNLLFRPNEDMVFCTETVENTYWPRFVVATFDEALRLESGHLKAIWNGRERQGQIVPSE